MGEKTVKKKSYEIDSLVEIDNDIDLINEHTINKLTKDDVYTFKVILCDNDLDRVYDKMTDKFLEDFANSSKGLTGLKDHDWESDNQVSRLYDTEVITSDELNQLGEPRKYVLGKAYTLRKYTDYIDKINAGLLKEVSVSFDSVGDTCSVCGCITCKNGDIAECENGHIAGQMYDDKLCYNNINNLTESFEWSLVAVPCQRRAGIKNKNKSGGNSLMKKSQFMLQRLLNSKSLKEVDESTKKEIEEIVEIDSDVELSEKDIKDLINENARLKAEVEKLKDRVREAESGRTRDKIEAIVSKEIDDMKPLTPVVKENIMKEIDWDDLKMEDGQIPGLPDVFAGIKERYKGLIDVKLDGDVTSLEDKDKLEIEKEDDKEEDKEELKVEDELRFKKKSITRDITFNVGDKAKSKSNKPVKSGRTFK